jgi:NDP-sugar pyrophosphorylase family protein
MMIDYLKARRNFGMNIEISREDELLDTGGGLKKAAWFFRDEPEQPFILHNVDVISTIDLDRMIRYHRDNDALATLAMQDRKTSRPLYFDSRQLLCGRRTSAGDEIVRPSDSMRALAFSGIHVIAPRFLGTMHEDGAFSIIPSYLRSSSEGQKIMAFRADEYYWRDLGKPENLEQAERDFQQGVLSA